ncbi:acyl-CoA dehydrogenase family protein [Sandarakinorhabdus sp.]|uniref:acyl-CoA dehydrogenase family protein n=1 Tax=Sandarakinorhabdus sp. TaxID=1916663 RepID=UPI00333E712E
MDTVVIDQASRMLAHEASDARLRQARAGQVADGWDVIEAAGLPLALAAEYSAETDGLPGLGAATILAIARAHGRVGAPWPLAEAMTNPIFPRTHWLAALAAAEIAGLCETVLALTLDWTQTRQQFGKPLSKNQAVQHSLAQMAAETAAAGAAVGLAGLGLGLALSSSDEAMVAAAKARASEAAGVVAALAHQLHGAIGVTEDYRLQLFTRALWQRRDTAGSEHLWHQQLGADVLKCGSLWRLVTDEPLGDTAETASTGDRFRFPVVAETAAHAALRAQVRSFLADENLYALPPEIRAHSWNGHSPEFSRKLGARGWLGMTWPKALGGHENSALERLVVIEELLAAGAPVAAHWIADRQTGPLLLKYGTPAQQAALLPAIARGEAFACIGMSEPGSGSDLAALTTRADPVPGGWRVSGTKLWTTYAHKAHWMILLCRTQPGERHHGLSQLLVAMDSPGITIRPIIDLMGDHHFNEVHFDNVFVPADALVGREGDGWAQVMSELAFERSGPERFLSTLVLLEALVTALGPDAPPAAHPAIGRAAAHLMVLRLMARGMAFLLEQGEDPALEAAMVKDLGASFEQSIPELARALLPHVPPDRLTPSLLATIATTTAIAPMVSLRGGTREILRGIIARGLGVR